ncbi:MAG: Hpt domain-containing protein [Gammaproteobacteria bacterium]
MQHADIHLDPDAIAALRALQMPGRPSIVLRVFDLFETSTASLLIELEQGLASGDLSLVTRAAHTLKSSSANIGATALAAQAKAIEHCGREGDLEGCKAAGAGLQALLDTTLAAVAALRCEEAA